MKKQQQQHKTEHSCSLTVSGSSTHFAPPELTPEFLIVEKESLTAHFDILLHAYQIFFQR